MAWSGTWTDKPPPPPFSVPSEIDDVFAFFVFLVVRSFLSPPIPRDRPGRSKWPDEGERRFGSHLYATANRETLLGTDELYYTRNNFIRQKHRLQVCSFAASRYSQRPSLPQRDLSPAGTTAHLTRKEKMEGSAANFTTLSSSSSSSTPPPPTLCKRGCSSPRKVKRRTDAK